MRLVVPALLLAAAVPASTFAQSLSASRADSRAWVRAEFARADGNRDGVLSRGEVTRAVNRHYGR